MKKILLFSVAICSLFLSILLTLDVGRETYDKIFDNIISKGFLYFNANDLQLIEYDIARSLYTMLTKWRNKALYIKRYSSFLASRIPLSWKKENINKSRIGTTIEGLIPKA